MTNIDLEKRFSDIETILRKLMADNVGGRKPTALSAALNWSKPYIVPFVFGAILGFLISFVSQPQTTSQHQTIQQQAALGGAVIPFPNGSLSPSPLALLPNDSNVGTADSSLTNSSELPLHVSRPADAGQTNSMRLFRPLGQRMR